MRTPLSARLGVEHPLMLAPMAGGAATPALVAAVSEAGALGSYGGAYLSPERLRDEIRAIRQRTQKPFMVNLQIDDGVDEWPEPAQRALQPYRDELGLAPAEPQPQIPWRALFAVILAERPALFGFTYGVPPPDVLDACRNAGILTVGTATSVAEARKLDEAGVDVITAQGSEAGGHRGTFVSAAEPPLIGTLALVPQVVDAVRAPVVAAGGIMDGRGVVAALALGAQAASLGTAFLRCPEAGTSAPWRAALQHARDDATVVTRAFSGRPARGLANRFTRELSAAPLAPWPAQNSLTRDIRAAAARAGDAQLLSLWAGQAAPLGRELPAGELVAQIVREADEVVQRL